MEKRKFKYNCHNCPFAWDNFKNLTPEELILISESKFEASFRAGETILKAGTPASSAVFLISGIGKIYLEGMDNKNMILSIVKPGQLIVGPGVYVDQRHHYNFTALTDIDACFLNVDILKQLVFSNSRFAEGWLIDISKKSLAMHNRFITLTQKKMPGRLADSIIMLADNIAQSDEFEMVLSRQELGELSNMAKESVIRILKEFEDEGVIVQDHKRMKITNREKLNAISLHG